MLHTAFLVLLPIPCWACASVDMMVSIALELVLGFTTLTPYPCVGDVICSVLDL